MAREEMVATFGLEDGPFQAGLKRVNRAAEMSAKQMAQSWGRGAASGERAMMRSATAMERGVTKMAAKGVAAMIGLGSATSIAARGMQEYAKQSDGAAASLGRLDAARKRLLTGLGRDLMQGGVADGLAGILNGAESFRSSAVDSLTDLFGGDSKGLREAAALDERVTANGRRMEALGTLRRGAAIEDARARGDDITAERLSGEEAARAAVEQARQNGLTGADLEEVRSRTLAPFNARIRQMQAEQGDKDRRLESERAVALGDLGLASKIRQARAAGNEGEADRLEVERRFVRQRASLEMREAQGEDGRTLMSEYLTALEERDIALEEIARREEAVKSQQRESATMAKEELDLSIRALEIEEMRAEGKEREADAAAAKLEYEQRVAEINRDENLTEAEKERFRAAAAGARDATLKGIEPEAGATRSLDIGLGSRIQGQALGGASDGLSELKKQTTLLQKIADQGMPAVLG